MMFGSDLKLSLLRSCDAHMVLKLEKRKLAREGQTSHLPHYKGMCNT